jgi:hypothetical protein
LSPHKVPREGTGATKTAASSQSSVCIGALCSDSAALPGVEERRLRFVELRGQQRES